MEDLILVAASGLAREVAETVTAARSHRIVGIVDDDIELHGTDVAGIPVLGDLDQLHLHRSAQVVVCAGLGTSRRSIVERFDEQGIYSYRFATIIHPSVHVPRSCSIGAGSVLLANVAITADVRIGRHVVAMPNVTLTHDDAIGDYATLCAGVSLAGLVTVGEAAYIGANASVREYVQVGYDAVLGMGSALLSDLPDGQTWAGVPAQLLDPKPVRLTITRPLGETS